MRLHPTTSPATVADLVMRLWRFERTGQFEDGLRELSEEWAEPHFEPDTSGLPERQSLELQLRFASLFGFQGHIRKIKDSQLRARNILTRVREGFAALGNDEKTSECEDHIALTYWRTGEFSEARTWLESANARPLAKSSFARLFSIMILMLVNIGEQVYGSNIDLFSEHEQTFRTYGDDLLTGSFYVNAGIGFMEAGRTEEAIQCYEFARLLFERSSIRAYLGTVENELGHVYMAVGKFAQAHRSVDRGIELFRETGDLTREGQLLDTKAAIFLEEGKTDEALKTVKNAVGILKGGENMGYLAETMLTEAKIVLKSGDFIAAVSSLFEAVQIARTNAGNDFANTLIEQFEHAVKEANGPSTKAEKATHDLETGELELLLPPSLSNFDEYQGIWINNSHLEGAGVSKGSLAVVVKDSIKRGDLVAISELASGEISCGFFDSEFGIACLDGCDSEPQLFDQQDVKVIGKIVGVCGTDKDPDGKLIVRPLAQRPLSSEI